MSHFNKALKDMGMNRRDFDRPARMVTRTAGAFLFIWIISALASLAGLCVLGYIAWHFIQKFW